MYNYQLRPQIKILLSKIFSYFLIIYIFFILGRSVWLNWQLKLETQMLQKQIDDGKIENTNMRNLLLYYQSDSFKEVEARKKLSLKKPGEYVMAVPTRKYDSYQAETQAQQDQIATKSQQENIPHYKLWWLYFTK